MGEQRAADWTVSEKERSPIKSLQNGQQLPRAQGKRSLQEIFESIDSHIWTQPPERHRLWK